MLSTLSSLDFFQSTYQSITKMLNLLELTVTTREMRCRPVLLDCVRFSLLPLTVLEIGIAAIATATATDTAITTATVKTETEANRALSKYQKLWYLQQIEYPEIAELKGIVNINAAIASVSSFMAAYKAVKSHGIPEKDPNKKSAKSDKQTVDASLPVATANISDMESIPLVGSNGVSPKFIADIADITLPSTIKVNGVVTIKKP